MRFRLFQKLRGSSPAASSPSAFFPGELVADEFDEFPPDRFDRMLRDLSFTSRSRISSCSLLLRPERFASRAFEVAFGLSSVDGFVAVAFFDGGVEDAVLALPVAFLP